MKDVKERKCLNCDTDISHTFKLQKYCCNGCKGLYQLKKEKEKKNGKRKRSIK